jgi:GST-like protein
MYTLYGFKGSGSAAVKLALELAELPYRLVDAASWEPGSAADELQRLNPLRQIPTFYSK